MSTGTLFIFSKSPRSNWLPAFVKELGLDLTIRDIKDDPENVKEFPLSKGPALKMANGFKLTETVAIAEYLPAIANSPLAGSSLQEKASITQWISFINFDVSIAGYGLMFFAKTDEEKKAKMDTLTFLCSHMDSHLKDSKFLTGPEYRTCDVFAVHTVSCFLGVFGLADKYPNLARWKADLKAVCPTTKELD